MDKTKGKNFVDRKKTGSNLKGQGRKAKTLEIEDELCSFIEQCNSLGIAIGLTEIINESLKLDTILKNKSIFPLLTWYYLFIRSNGFSIHKITHIGEAESHNSKEYTETFFIILYNILLNNRIYDQFDLVDNMDEAAICYENI